MKKLQITLALIVFSIVAFAQEAETEKIMPGPAFTFVEKLHDFGDIKQGEKVEYTFQFENSGDEPLIITDVKVTCGCTATDWPREPIMPGEESSITVEFNSAGKKGRQNKVVSIISNAVSSLNQVTIAANVKVGDDTN